MNKTNILKMSSITMSLSESSHFEYFVAESMRLSEMVETPEGGLVLPSIKDMALLVEHIKREEYGKTLNSWDSGRDVSGFRSISDKHSQVKILNMQGDTGGCSIEAYYNGNGRDFNSWRVGKSDSDQEPVCSDDLVMNEDDRVFTKKELTLARFIMPDFVEVLREGIEIYRNYIIKALELEIINTRVAAGVLDLRAIMNAEPQLIKYR